MMDRGGGIEKEPPGVVMEEKLCVAVGKYVKESKSTLLWALRNSGGKKICILHVHEPAQNIPIMGGKFPVNKVKEQEVQAYRELERQQMHKLLNKYLLICALEGLWTEKLYIEMNNIEQGIVELVSQHGIRWLVMGAAADKHYSKKMRTLKSKKAIFINQQAPLFCHIQFVCNGNLIHTREDSFDRTEIGVGSPLPLASPVTPTGASQPDNLRSRSLTNGLSNHVRPTNPVQARALSINESSPMGAVTPTGESQPDNLRSRSLTNGLSNHVRPTNLVRARALSVNDSSPMGTGRMPIMQGQLGAERSADEWEGISRSPTQGSRHSTLSSSDVAGTLDAISIIGDEESNDGTVFPSVCESNDDLQNSSPLKELHEEVNDELYNQLEQAILEAENSKREAFEEFVKRRKVEKEAIEAIRKAKASESLYSMKMKQRKEMEETLAREKQEIDKLKNQKAEVMEELRIAQEQKSVMESQIADSDRMVKELEEKIISAIELLITLKKERDELQIERDNAVREAEELRNRQEEEASSSQRTALFSEFSFLDIREATHNFDPSLKIGEGGYGSVYKGSLRHTQVAIKMLHSHSLQGHLEFQQEVEVLSRVRHPNLITLIGACPESWSLIYEYLPNGTLEDRFACKDNTVPLSWQTRIRIAAEICSALVFLHSNKPYSIVHGDLKPANILLDSNFISKLGDFGICRLIPHNEHSPDTSTLCCITDPKGTLLYMDPEFLATGELTPKSDVYSYGIVLLRLLTGRPALGIAKEVQYALEKGSLNVLLDRSAGDWPFVQAKQLAHLALSCCNMNRKSRPDLGSEVWRVLEQMRASCGTSSSFRLGSEEHYRIPSYFMCPIFQEIMRDPHIAADGFTYEAEAFKGWLDAGHDTSPMTNHKLDHCNLIPNHALRSAIQEWLQQP